MSEQNSRRIRRRRRPRTNKHIDAMDILFSESYSEFQTLSTQPTAVVSDECEFANELRQKLIRIEAQASRVCVLYVQQPIFNEFARRLRQVMFDSKDKVIKCTINHIKGETVKGIEYDFKHVIPVAPAEGMDEIKVAVTGVIVMDNSLYPSMKFYKDYIAPIGVYRYPVEHIGVCVDGGVLGKSVNMGCRMLNELRDRLEPQTSEVKTIWRRPETPIDASSHAPKPVRSRRVVLERLHSTQREEYLSELERECHKAIRDLEQADLNAGFKYNRDEYLDFNEEAYDDECVTQDSDCSDIIVVE